jgi:hypothetical protein
MKTLCRLLPDKHLDCGVDGVDPEQEQEIIDVLTALDWMPNPWATAESMITKRCHCSPEQAKIILQKLDGRIDTISESGGNLQVGVPMKASWKWVVKRT